MEKEGKIGDQQLLRLKTLIEVGLIGEQQLLRLKTLIEVGFRMINIKMAEVKITIKMKIFKRGLIKIKKAIKSVNRSPNFSIDLQNL
jgi:hypothetical protein